MTTVKELALKYYPKLWDKNRIDTLYKADKLTTEEYLEVLEITEEKSDSINL